jgi:hypothetical protein
MSDRQKLLSKAAGQASTRLKQRFQTQWNSLMQEEALKLGVEWEPRKSPEEREREKARELLAKYPDLLEQPDEAEPEHEG